MPAMATKNDFQIDRRVAIALDAMTTPQRAALEPLLRGKAEFLAHASRPGISRKLPADRPLYTMRAGPELRVIYTKEDNNVVVLDIMHKATMEGFRSKPRSVKRDAGRAAVKRDKPNQIKKI
jgi:hypothetical protein